MMGQGSRVPTSQGTVLVRGARQLLTLRGPRELRRGSALAELGVIHDGAVLIVDGMAPACVNSPWPPEQGCLLPPESVRASD